MENKFIKKINFIFVLFLLSLIISCSYDYSSRTSNVKYLGYCPTMKNHAFEYARNNNFIAVEVETTSIALENLRKGNFDAVIVGRKAHQNEITSNINGTQLKEGYTLVADSRNIIPESQLSDYIIHTYLDSNITDKLLPNLEIFHYENFETAFAEGVSGYPNAMLIDWRDYQDNFQLLIPMRGNSKTPEFRTPFLYKISE